jgi:hypothetical protein
MIGQRSSLGADVLIPHHTVSSNDYTSFRRRLDRYRSHTHPNPV